MTSAVKEQGCMKALQISLLVLLFSFTEQTIAEREVCPSLIVADLALVVLVIQLFVVVKKLRCSILATV